MSAGRMTGRLVREPWYFLEKQHAGPGIWLFDAQGKDDAAMAVASISSGASPFGRGRAQGAPMAQDGGFPGLEEKMSPAATIQFCRRVRGERPWPFQIFAGLSVRAPPG